MHFLKQTFIPHHANSYRPHLIRRHGLAFALLLIVGSYILNGLQSSAQPQVLGYASNITVSGLLSSTNAERVAAGKSALNINSKLNAAAQGKANHMIANDYWAHTSPDGVTPWYWFDNSGYDYLAAGENLAYGFDTSNGVVDGWMNSQSHRDNLLNGIYEDVGFGIANGSSFQGGPNTVVVAHYGDPVTSSGLSAPSSGSTEAAEASNPQSEPAPAPAPVKKAAPKKEPVKQPPEPAEETPTEPEPEESASESEPTLTTSDTPRRFTNLEALLRGQAAWSLYVAAIVSLSIGFVYLYRHVIFIHKTIIKGEQYLVHHPMLEASIVYALIWLLLAGNFGNIL